VATSAAPNATCSDTTLLFKHARVASTHARRRRACSSALHSSSTAARSVRSMAASGRLRAASAPASCATSGTTACSSAALQRAPPRPSASLPTTVLRRGGARVARGGVRIATAGRRQRRCPGQWRPQHTICLYGSTLQVVHASHVCMCPCRNRARQRGGPREVRDEAGSNRAARTAGTAAG
jgi:hypothetical protein